MSAYTVRFCNRHWTDVESWDEGRQEIPWDHKTVEFGHFRDWEIEPSVDRNPHFTIEEDGKVLETYYHDPFFGFMAGQNRTSIPPPNATLYWGDEESNTTVYNSFMAALKHVPHNYHQLLDPIWEQAGISIEDIQNEMEALDRYTLVEHNGATIESSTWIYKRQFFLFWEDQ